MKKRKQEKWQKELKEGVIEVKNLLKILNLNSEDAPYKIKGFNKNDGFFTLKAPQDFVKRITSNNWFDPLLLQILPLKEESEKKKNFVQDAVEDKKYEVYPGFIHKYKNRVLLIASSVCCIHCRYCFRQHFDYQKKQSQTDIISYLKKHPEIEEIILSGGDPLSLPTSKLQSLIEKITPYVKRVRFHSRYPIALPSRVNATFLKFIKKLNESVDVIFVVHCNHPQELQGKCSKALQKLSATVTTLNQSVLLKNINDNFNVQKELNENLFHLGVLPYYLNQLDQAQGTHHFKVPIKQGNKIIKELKNTSPHYLVPRYVKDEGLATHKTVIN